MERSRYGDGDHIRYDGDHRRYEGDRRRFEDPDQYSHYQNYQEIQAQIARHDYYQQRYHQYLAHQAALAHSAHHHAAHPSHTSSTSSLMPPPPVPPRGLSDYQLPSYPATEPRGNWDHRLAMSGHQPRSLTPSFPHESTRSTSASYLQDRTRSASPSSRLQAQTPISQVGYMSQHSYKAPLSASLHPPQSTPLHSSQHSYSLDYMGYDERLQPRQGAYGADSSTFSNSLPRRSNRGQNGIISEAARV